MYNFQWSSEDGRFRVLLRLVVGLYFYSIIQVSFSLFSGIIHRKNQNVLQHSNLQHVGSHKHLIILIQ